MGGRRHLWTSRHGRPSQNTDNGVNQSKHVYIILHSAMEEVTMDELQAGQVTPQRQLF